MGWNRVVLAWPVFLYFEVWAVATAKVEQGCGILAGGRGFMFHPRSGLVARTHWLSSSLVKKMFGCFVEFPLDVFKCSMEHTHRTFLSTTSITRVSPLLEPRKSTILCV